MPFSADRILIAALMRLSLPDHTVRLCDGGEVRWTQPNGTVEIFRSVDPVWGSVEAIEDVTESVGDDAPEGALTFLPATAAAASDLQNPRNQGAPLQFWLAELTPNAQVLHAELVFDGLLDSTTLRLDRGSRRLDMTYMSRAERLFLINEGNVLSPRFHKSVWPGELGLDNATGVPGVIAWGVETPPRGQSAGGTGGSPGGGGGGGGAFGDIFREIQERLRAD